MDDDDPISDSLELEEARAYGISYILYYLSALRSNLLKG
jgi:indole-3-glycerol phosphate synthase